MGDVATALVAWLVLYTYPTVVVVAAGSITTDGDDAPDFWVLFGLIVAAAVVGDVVSYSLGRWAGHLVVGRWGARVGVTAERLVAVERRLERWGGLLVVVTRCLLTGLALPTNLVAGASSYPMMRFAAFSLLGESIWAGQLLSLGWYFGASWVALLDYLDDAITLLTALAAAIVLVWLLLRLLKPSGQPSAVNRQEEVPPSPEQHSSADR
jgi:membrane-associated protein